MLVRRENKIIRCTEGLELDNDDGKRCTIKKKYK
jgi:hypothetical protein